MAKAQLRPEAREFFATLTEAIVMNPFSEKRTAMLGRLVAGRPEEAWSLNPHDYAMVAELDRRIADLDRDGHHRLESFAAEDREILELVFMYQIYHRLVPEFDALIHSQLDEPEASIEVPFAPEALAACTRRGFSEQAALRLFAFSYQLRRAFYFIVASLVGASESIRRLRLQLWNSVFTFDLGTYSRVLMGRMEDFSTLLLGETGTGKGQAAAAIGRSGFIPFDPKTNRFVTNFNQAFIAINLLEYSESLIESELFGHRKGAFTGAIENHRGLFERCSAHGSLFLDELGDVGVPIQIKLLEVLQHRTYSPVGSHETLRFAGRVIGATNRPLVELRRQGSFRDDFFYRLCSDAIIIPPLRQHIDEYAGEFELLVSYLIERITGGEHHPLTHFVLERLRATLPAGYPWPGNVRELEQAMRSILMTGDYKGDPIALEPDPESGLAEQMRNGSMTAQELVAGYCALLYRQLGSYQSVSRCVGLDRRTVKKYVDQDRSLPKANTEP